MRGQSRPFLLTLALMLLSFLLAVSVRSQQLFAGTATSSYVFARSWGSTGIDGQHNWSLVSMAKFSTPIAGFTALWW